MALIKCLTRSTIRSTLYQKCIWISLGPCGFLKMFRLLLCNRLEAFLKFLKNSGYSSLMMMMMMMMIAVFSIQHAVHMKRVKQEVQDLYKALPIEQSNEK